MKKNKNKKNNKNFGFRSKPKTISPPALTFEAACNLKKLSVLWLFMAASFNFIVFGLINNLVSLQIDNGYVIAGAVVYFCSLALFFIFCLDSDPESFHSSINNSIVLYPLFLFFKLFLGPEYLEAINFFLIIIYMSITTFFIFYLICSYTYVTLMGIFAYIFLVSQLAYSFNYVEHASLLGVLGFFIGFNFYLAFYFTLKKNSQDNAFSVLNSCYFGIFIFYFIIFEFIMSEGFMLFSIIFLLFFILFIYILSVV